MIDYDDEAGEQYDSRTEEEYEDEVPYSTSFLFFSSFVPQSPQSLVDTDIIVYGRRSRLKDGGPKCRVPMKLMHP